MVRDLSIGVSSGLFGIPTPDSYRECRDSGIGCVELVIHGAYTQLDETALRDEIARKGPGRTLAA